MTRKRELTSMQRKYVEELLSDPERNQMAAALRAGYSKTTARSASFTLMKSKAVQEAIKGHEKAIVKETGITPHRIMSELAKIGFANMQDYAAIIEEGRSLKDIPREHAAVIKDLSIDVSSSERGENAYTSKKVKISLADKRAALIDMGKQIGMFKDKVEHSGTLSLQTLIEASMRLPNVIRDSQEPAEADIIDSEVVDTPFIERQPEAV